MAKTTSNLVLRLSRTQRELFENIKAFLHYKIKSFTPVQALEDMAKVICYQEEILKCQHISALESLCHKLYQPRRKAPSFSYGDIRLAPAWLC
ncbi:hypothetical protein [Helicobacter bizzozeronii]|uniref:hypothetical protein n=1 Tax=Helicobacter bizzozeronii TaxID=56877 RepID=UPI001F4698AF|nr:hypothetical protein [Helicobacter bizzozeronii]